MRRILLACSMAMLVFPSSAYSQPDWRPLAVDLVKSEKPGYGGVSGVIVHRQSGDVFIFLSDKGLYKSSDQGKSWMKPERAFKGRTETPSCLMIDPVGDSKRMIVALVYGSPIAVSPDLGRDWRIMENKSNHVDWFAIDWSDPELKFVLTLKHEANGLMLASRDSGRSFVEVGKNFGPAWVFDNKTAVVVEAKTKAKPKPRLLRTTDGAKTFEPVVDFTARALPRWYNGSLYWITDDALVSSSDKGQTWKKISGVKNGRWGPIFGKNAQHMFILTTAGVLESTDGGAAWSKPVPLPKSLRSVDFMTWLDYDPTNDVLYATHMGDGLYKLDRKK